MFMLHHVLKSNPSCEKDPKKTPDPVLSPRPRFVPPPSKEELKKTPVHCVPLFYRQVSRNWQCATHAGLRRKHRVGTEIAGPIDILLHSFCKVGILLLPVLSTQYFHGPIQPLVDSDMDFHFPSEFRIPRILPVVFEELLLLHLFPDLQRLAYLTTQMPIRHF